MSHITDIILTLFCDETKDNLGSRECLRELDFFLADNGGQPLYQADRIRNESVKGKSMQAEVFVGCHNGLDIEAFVDIFAHLKWEFAPECAQLFLKDEHEDIFTVYKSCWSNGDRS